MWKWTEVIQRIRASTWLLSVCSQETSCEHSQEAGRVWALDRGGVGSVSVCVCVCVSEDSTSQWQEQIGPGKTSLNAGGQVSGLVVPISQRGQLRLGKVKPPLDSGRSGASVRACLRSLLLLWGEGG